MKNFFKTFLVTVLLFVGCSDSDSDNYIEESGTIEMEDVIISAKTGGEILKIVKDEGDLVSAGDTVLIIDSESYRLQLKQALALKDISEAQLQLLEKGSRSEDIKQAEEMVNQAKANLDVADADNSRFRKLLEEQAITQKQYDDISARFNISLAQYNSAAANLKKIKRIARVEEIKAAKAHLDQAEANVEIINKTIRDCFVKAPINGQIVKSFIEMGEFASPMTSLTKITDLSLGKLTVYVSEKNLGKVKLGQKAEITTDSYPDIKYEGKVIFISPEAEFTPKNIQTKDERTKLVFAVKIQIPNPNCELKAGMPADAKIDIKN